MSRVKAGDPGGCLPVELPRLPLGGCGFGDGHFPAKQTGSEKGRDLSKVAQLRIVSWGRKEKGVSPPVETLKGVLLTRNRWDHFVFVSEIIICPVTFSIYLASICSAPFGCQAQCLGLGIW